jgi:seryl-tRNA synthetase
MLDIKLFRENLDVIIESEKKRGKDIENAKKVLEYDKKWREALKAGDELKYKKNLVSVEISKLKKEGKPIDEKINEMRKISKKIEENDKKIEEFFRKREEFRYRVGNILHKDVPIGKSEEENKHVRFWGTPKVYKEFLKDFEKQTLGKVKPEVIDFKPKSHVDLLEAGLGDTIKAGEVSGSRFFYLKDELVLLNLALQKFALDFLRKKGFQLFYTPFMLKGDIIAKAAELADFREMLYKIEGEDLYLIATAEQTLAAYHSNEIIDEKDLPKLYAGFSTNFRKEAGSHGKDTKGIFRVHQFDKVEQFIFCKPEESWMWFEKLIKNAEEIYQKLGLPYRIMNICSGQINDNAAMKYDLEVWMPAQGKYREVVSCSNCTDYQPRKLNVRLLRKNGEKDFVHSLNSTAIATQRTIVAILENYQQDDGSIKIPDVLIPYTGFEKIKK